MSRLLVERVEDGGGWLKERSEEKRRGILERARIRVGVGRIGRERRGRRRGGRDMEG